MMTTATEGRAKAGTAPICAGKAPSFPFLFALVLLFLLLPAKAHAADFKAVPIISVEDGSEREIISLDACIRIAFKKHPQIKEAIAMKNAAGARLTRAKSNFYPNVSLGSSYRRSESKNTSTSQGVLLPVSVNKSDSYYNGISVSQLLYDFGRTGYRVMAASENLKAANYDLLTDVDQIILNIREAYFVAVAAEKTLDVQRETVRQQELHLKQARGFYQIGTRSRIEVTKAEVDLANARLELIKAGNNVDLTRVILANAIGIAENFNYSLDDQVRMAELDLDSTKAVEYARSKRPEMLRYAALENSYNASLSLARANYMPSVNGTSSLGYQDNRLIFRDFFWGWGVNLSFDIFTGGEKAGALQEARFNLEALQAQKDRQWHTIFQEVQKAFLSLEEARSSITVLEKTLDQARENFALAQGRYEVGLSDNLEFNDAQVLFQKAQINLIRAILDYQVARARLEKATGMTLLGKELIDDMDEMINR
jgi:outer membrane protein TolC